MREEEILEGIENLKDIFKHAEMTGKDITIWNVKRYIKVLERNYRFIPKRKDTTLYNNIKYKTSKRYSKSRDRRN